MLLGAAGSARLLRLLILVLLGIELQVKEAVEITAGSATVSATAAVRTSLWDPPPDSDRSFSTDNAPGLDTGCIFRSQGPITYTIEIKRFIGELNPDGTLKNADALIAAGLVSPRVKLIMPGFDVDSAANVSGVPPEVDRVSFNGEAVGILEGVNNDWFLNSFEIDIRKVKFAEAGTGGGEPTGGVNEIRIDIDTASANENWCTSVDWGNASFRALSPVILVHGNGSDPGFFRRMGFVDELVARRIPFDFVNLGPPNFIETNGFEVNKQIQSLVRQIGAKNIHIVTHSKGGLDTREFLGRYYGAQRGMYKILTLTTLSTPHNGSVLADLALERHNAAARVGRLGRVEFEGFPDYTRQLVALATWGGVDNGRRNLTTGFVGGFNRENVGRIGSLGITYGTVAADADLNGNARMDRENPDEYFHLRTESAELRRLDEQTVPVTGHPVGRQLSRFVVDSLYQILRQTATVSVSYRTQGIWPATREVATIRSNPNPAPLGNDTLVTIPSARGEGSFQPLVRNTFTFQGGAGRNHSNVADRGVAQRVIPWMIEAERRAGGLK